MRLGRRTALYIVDGSHEWESRKTPAQLKETVLSQFAMPELRMTAGTPPQEGPR